MSRATFHSRYAVPKHKREVTSTGHRLGDLIRVIVEPGEVDSLKDAGAGEFAVMDLKTKEKAFCELPYGATPASVKTLIESHFDSHATRATEKLWIV
jgi:hypothetical protein